MSKIIRTVEVSAEIDAAIERLAKDTAQTPSQIVADAVERLLADYDDLSVDLERLAEYDRTGEALDEEEVARRIEALKQRNRQNSTA